MTDRESIVQLYNEMYTAMINKNRVELERVHDDSFVLVHMTGTRQTKEVYINSIMDGTLNYYAYDIKDLNIAVDGGEAALSASVTLTAKVYGASGSWTLPVNARFTKIDGQWIAHN